METKRCSKCKEILPLSKFYSDPRNKKHGRTSACGQCIYKQQMRYRDKSYFMTTHHNKASECRRKGVPYDLDQDYLKSIWTEECPIFGFKFTPREGRHLPTCPNLDRIDPTKGYVKGNVVWISRKANLIKSDASLADIEKVVDYLKQKTREPIP